MSCSSSSSSLSLSWPVLLCFCNFSHFLICFSSDFCHNCSISCLDFIGRVCNCLRQALYFALFRSHSIWNFFTPFSLNLFKCCFALSRRMNSPSPLLQDLGISTSWAWLSFHNSEISWLMVTGSLFNIPLILLLNPSLTLVLRCVGVSRYSLLS